MISHRFPNNKRFAFTVFDDTDHSTVANTRLVYQLLVDLGIRTTKSVWVLPSLPGARIGGSSLQENEYLDFVLWLQSQGFEISLHNVQNHNATREVIERGFEEFHYLLKTSPRIHCNHSMNRENIYWGARRLRRATTRLAYNLATCFTRMYYFQGHVENSPYFWGDICKSRISYVRNLVFDEINLDRINPTMPYHDPAKPFVNYWFSSSEGSTVDRFCRMLGEENQDKLEAEGGVCIMYTHFANGFCDQGKLHPNFQRLMRRLAKKDAWFVPVSALLDHLKKSKQNSVIPQRELAHMEHRWFLSKLYKGTT